MSVTPSKAWAAPWLIRSVLICSIQVGDASRTSILRYIPPKGEGSGDWLGLARRSDTRRNLPSTYREESSSEQLSRFLRTLGIGSQSMLESVLQGQIGTGHIMSSLVSMILSSLSLRADPMIGYERDPSMPYDYQESDMDPSWEDLGTGTWVNKDNEGFEVEDMDSDDDGARLSQNVSMASAMSKLAYLDLNEISEDPRFENIVLRQAIGFPVFVDGDSQYDQQAYMYLFPDTRTMWVAFRGTESIVDMKYDLDYRLIGVDNDHTDSIKAHAGFLHKWNSIRDAVMDTMLEHSAEFDYIIATGHSLGAAIATLSAPFLGERFPDKIVECITFGSPRVGNEYFVAWYTHLIDVSTRIANERDPVVHMPIEPEFHHVHEAYTISSSGRLWKLADSPAALRFINAITDIDWDSMMGSHRQDVYIERVAVARSHIERRLKRRTTPPFIDDDVHDDFGIMV